MCHDAGVRLNEAAACLCKTLWLRRAGLFDVERLSVERVDTPAQISQHRVEPGLQVLRRMQPPHRLVVARCRAGVNVDGSLALHVWFDNRHGKNPGRFRTYADQLRQMRELAVFGGNLKPF